jgi:hypothetical protein
MAWFGLYKEDLSSPYLICVEGVMCAWAFFFFFFYVHNKIIHHTTGWSVSVENKASVCPKNAIGLPNPWPC